MVRQVPMGRHERAKLGQEQLTNSGNRVEEVYPGVESQMQMTCEVAALASLWPESLLAESETEKSRPVEGAMLSRCANSQCSRPFLRLRQGKLFLVETEFLANSRELTAPSSHRMRQQV